MQTHDSEIPIMFKGIKLKTFLSTPEEWHALAIGFFEVLCPWPSSLRAPTCRSEAISGEEHYYLTGRGVGFIALLLILIGLAKLIKEVLL